MLLSRVSERSTANRVTSLACPIYRGRSSRRDEGKVPKVGGWLRIVRPVYIARLVVGRFASTRQVTALRYACRVYRYHSPVSTYNQFSSRFRSVACALCFRCYCSAWYANLRRCDCAFASDPRQYRSNTCAEQNGTTGWWKVLRLLGRFSVTYRN